MKPVHSCLECFHTVKHIGSPAVQALAYRPYVFCNLHTMNKSKDCTRCEVKYILKL